MDGRKRYVQQVLSVSHVSDKMEDIMNKCFFYRKNNGGPGASGNGKRDKHFKVYIGGAGER